LHGINVDAGIFMSYVGLFSYYNFDNWAYQPSYVSSNTPWFFNGVRVQIFPTAHLKIEPWFVNGWQAYGRFNNRPGIGGQILWRPNGWLSILGNQYVLGEDALNTPGRVRYHTDDSIEIKYYDHPERMLSKAAFSLTGDLGCEHGGGVSCYGNSAKGPKQDFLGFMLYNRLWFHKDLYGFTLGGGKINNPGRYLVLLPPINGMTASSAAINSPYFTENPGDPYKAWDASATFDYMPSQYITFRWEFDHRAANVPYFSGKNGITPPGGNTGDPTKPVAGWAPDLVKDENRIDLSILVKF
jgi:Putative beta-barrel porin-2, OmpL-like. bbp2